MKLIWRLVKNIRSIMRRLSRLTILLFFVAGVAGAQLYSALFQHPPDAARPWVFWYWMQAAVSREGIRADLQAMKEAGIGGAYLMPIKGVANPPLIDPPIEQ